MSHFVLQTTSIVTSVYRHSPRHSPRRWPVLLSVRTRRRYGNRHRRRRSRRSSSSPLSSAPMSSSVSTTKGRRKLFGEARQVGGLVMNKLEMLQAKFKKRPSEKLFLSIFHRCSPVVPNLFRGPTSRPRQYIVPTERRTSLRLCSARASKNPCRLSSKDTKTLG